MMSIQMLQQTGHAKSVFGAPSRAFPREPAAELGRSLAPGAKAAH
jgi:hypothetical protein